MSLHRRRIPGIPFTGVLGALRSLNLPGALALRNSGSSYWPWLKLVGGGFVSGKNKVVND